MLTASQLQPTNSTAMQPTCMPMKGMERIQSIRCSFSGRASAVSAGMNQRRKDLTKTGRCFFIRMENLWREGEGADRSLDTVREFGTFATRIRDGPPLSSDRRGSHPRSKGDFQSESAALPARTGRGVY